MDKEILFYREPWSRCIAVIIKENDYVLSVNDKRDGYIFKKHKDGEYLHPTITIPVEMSQKMIDMLWDCGLRPSQAAGSAGQLDATKYHLEDMRRIIFDKKATNENILPK